jgi:hypothetical protein
MCAKCRRRRRRAEFSPDASLFCIECSTTMRRCDGAIGHDRFRFTGCGEWKPITEFRAKIFRDNGIWLCRSCYAAWRVHLRGLTSLWRPSLAGETEAEARRVRDERMAAAWRENVSLDVLFERDAGMCWICEQAVLRDDASADHVVPLAHGGLHEYANVRLAHVLCNSRRGGNAWLGPKRRRLYDVVTGGYDSR